LIEVLVIIVVAKLYGKAVAVNCYKYNVIASEQVQVFALSTPIPASVTGSTPWR